MKNPTATKTRTHGPYWYGKTPFHPGLLYEHLAAAQYKVVVGMDFGHGETVVYQYYLEPDIKTGEKKPTYVSAKMTQQGSTAIPTYIHYDASGNVMIGKDAIGDLEFHQHFKQPPKRWNTSVGGRTARELMRDFIRTLWQSILVYNDTIKDALAQDSLLLAVGCPSGGDWTTEESISAYGELVREATGCKHVEIFPESAAAIMANIQSAMAKTKGKDGEDQPEQAPLHTDRGVAIYDFGSSTLDFTYVLMGVVIFNYSVDLGGSQIDEAMLRKLLADNGLTEKDIPIGQRDHILAQLREHKENFYTRKSLPPQTIWLLEAGEDGQAVPDTYANSMTYRPSKDFMRAVLWEDKDIHIRNETYRNRGLSWGECCKEFVADTCKLISKYPCEAVVITGGTSYVTDAAEICRNTYGKAFPNAVFSPEEDRGASVAKGLCYAKSVESRSAEMIAEAKAALRGEAFNSVYKCLMDEAAEYMFEESWAATGSVYADLAQGGQPHPIANINAAINNKIQSNAELEERVRGFYAERLQESLTACQKLIQEIINNLSKVIYNTQLENLPQLAKIAAADVGNVVQNLDVTPLYKGAYLQGFLSMFDIFGLLKPLIEKAGILSHDRIMSLAGWYQNSNAKNGKKQSMVPGIKKELLEDGGLRADFDARVDEQFEIALGQITFLLYEQKENT